MTKQADVSPSETTKIASISGFNPSSHATAALLWLRCRISKFRRFYLRFHTGIALVRCGPFTEPAYWYD